MGFKCGIVGLPNVGKSTIFNGLTAKGAASENYPFCTIDPNVGIVEINDKRLDVLQSMIKSKKVIPAVVELVDIAGLVRGASKGEGLGNKFLSHIRETNALAHVVRCFDDNDITHVDDSVDPIRDIETIDTELILSDNETVEKNLVRFKKLTKSGGKENNAILEMLEALYSHLQALNPARSFKIPGDGKDEHILKAYKELHLITDKKVLYVCNVDEDSASGDKDNDYSLRVRARAKEEGSGVVIISGKIEEEISNLDESDKNDFLESLGMSEPGLDRLARSAYDLLGLMTYFTAGEKEIRAWTVSKGAKAPEAAGVIHTDFEQGYICSEVYSIDDLVEAKTKIKLKEAGKLRIEGKDYIVKDGDVMEFRFNI